EQFDVSANGQRFFVTNEDAGTVSVLELRSTTIQSRIPVGHEPEGVRISPNGRWALVTNENDSTLSVIDTRSLTFVR
ncbi:cytochrome D1 domain-containing protein, partial [Salmonella enterica]|uniref:cytochrome D1 domain-containing protein n=1 Tax=Salmonella enterica TaxID=28901 RepID=UPI003CEFA6C4